MQSRAEKDKNDLKNFVNEQNADSSDGIRDVHEKVSSSGGVRKKDEQL